MNGHRWDEALGYWVHDPNARYRLTAEALARYGERAAHLAGQTAVVVEGTTPEVEIGMKEWLVRFEPSGEVLALRPWALEAVP